ncbi:hypothetical protein R1flu_001632 [Riccia fluitans]|uniref:UDENN domain-containing protein n=1 Tax=Riccia fluitans TaxID=41844 RepID=A0ABD1Y6T1_9MARC
MNRSPVSRSESVGRPDGAAFRRWLVALCTIRFDLEQGQVVEECFPAGALSSEEELDVAFNSFPDSMSQAENRASIHDCVFFFRIRRRGAVANTTSPATVRRTASLAYERAAEVITPAASPASHVLKDLAEAGHTSAQGSPLRGASFESDSNRSAESSPLRDLGDVGSKSTRGSPVLRGGEASPLTGNGSPSFISRQGSGQQEEASTGSALRSGENAAGGGQSSSEGSWGLSVIDKLASVISPKLRPRDIGNAGESPPPKAIEDSPPRSSPSISRARENSILGSSRGGPGSGAQRYLYGFVFNRQRQDERLKRGGEQKSVVVLSERPFTCVYKPLVQILGPLYFDIGPRSLEMVAAEIALWPAPLHGQSMELSVSGTPIKAHLPPAHTLPPGSGNPIDEFTCAIAPAAPVARSVPQGIFQDADLFGMFRGVLMQLWVLWELLLVGEPLLVIAPTPSQCCEAVAALVGLVAPLPCSVDFRPYFTIHDPDFATLNALKEGEPVPPMVLGVTNLFFLKALRSLPHVISVGSTVSNSNRFKVISRTDSQNGSNGAKPSPGRLHIQVQLSPLKRFSPSNLLKAARVKKDGPISLMSEHKEALWTSFNSSTKPDTAILNRLVDAGTTPRTEESMTLVNNEILRRHFVELTTNFLSPFGPYLRASAPQEGASPFADPPPLPRFDAQEFLDGLAARGSGKFLAKRLRGNWLDLYRRFLKGPNFMPWFQRRRAVAEQEQHRIWRQARSKADVRGFLAKMSEVEIIDSFSAIERHLINELQIVQRAGLGNSEGPVCQKLRSDLRAIFNVLPKDMQQMLLFNPQRASLLQGGRELTKLPGRASFSFRSSDPATDTAALSRKADSFRMRSSTSPEITARRTLSLQRNSESPSITSKISPLVSPAPSNRAQELAEDPLDLEKH